MGTFSLTCGPTRQGYLQSSKCTFSPSSKTRRISTGASETARSTRSSYSPISHCSSASARQSAASYSQTNSASFPCALLAKGTPYSRACLIAVRWTCCRATGPSAHGYGSCGIVSETELVFTTRPFSSHIAGVFSLIAGIISLITQILIYIWLEESNAVRITLSILTVFAILPLVHLVPFPSRCGKRRSIVSY